MIFHKQHTPETWYNVLNVNEDATYEDIRSSYRSSLLNSHPDKLQNSREESADRFMKVQKAWEILGNSRTRSLYDAELRTLKSDATVTADDVILEDMMVEEGDGDDFELYYQCRCGDYFSVSSSEFENETGYRLSRNGQDEISVVTSDDVSESNARCWIQNPRKWGEAVKAWVNLAGYRERSLVSDVGMDHFKFVKKKTMDRNSCLN